MKTILKLLVTVAVLNAAYQAGRVAWTYYQFKDAAQQALIFGGHASPEQLHAQIMTRATEFGVPVAAEDVEVRRSELRTVAQARYTQPVELFPRYRYPAELSFTVDAIVVELAPGAAGR